MTTSATFTATTGRRRNSKGERGERRVAGEYRRMGYTVVSVAHQLDAETIAFLKAHDLCVVSNAYGCGFDLVVIDQDTGASFAVEVKTGHYKNRAADMISPLQRGAAAKLRDRYRVVVVDFHQSPPKLIETTDPMNKDSRVEL